MTNESNYRRIKSEFAEKSATARATADRRTQEVMAQFPELTLINNALAKTADKIFTLIAQGGNIATEMANLQKENAILVDQRNDIMTLGGYPVDYLEVKYQCENCNDSGFVVTFKEGKGATTMCECMRSALVIAGMDSSGLGNLLDQQTFDNFSLDYYSDTPQNHENATRVLNTCRSFATNFGSKKQNLLLIGGTGMGKTHLSTAIAREVIRQGYDVVYQTAQRFMNDFEERRFGRSYGESSDNNPCDRYTKCDLLILDDLGTEFTSGITVSSLYDVINTRLISGSRTIISTNLSQKDLRDAYNDRIVSRLFGEYTILPLLGGDIRMKKLRG